MRASYEQMNIYKHNLLIKIGQIMIQYLNCVSEKYLSTHGLTVPWIHIRICSYPKNYVTISYTN